MNELNPANGWLLISSDNTNENEIQKEKDLFVQISFYLILTFPELHISVP